MIANDVGHAVAWLDAGRPEIKKLSMFAERGFTFSGKQASTKDVDGFCQSAQSVIPNCVSLANYYDGSLAHTFPILAILIPAIVVDAEIYEVTYSEMDECLQVEATDHREHWGHTESIGPSIGARSDIRARAERLAP